MDTIKRLSDQEVIKTLSGETQASSIQGASVTSYGLQPVLFLKSIVDGAQSTHYFLNFCQEIDLPEGTHQVSIPKRSRYLGTGVSFATTEPTTADVAWTSISNATNVTATPTPQYGGCALTNYGLRTNAIVNLKYVRDELTYGIGEKLDQAIATALGDGTNSSSVLAGTQTLFGGDATSDATGAGATALATGDVITTDLVAKAAQRLKSKYFYYRTSNAGFGTETKVTATYFKNPWMPNTAEPFVLFIGPCQEETFRKDSQFVNASEYGSDKIVHNGEIGEYLGIKIVVTNNIESVASTGTAPDGNTGGCGADMTRCILMKAKKACAVVWGQKPTLKVFDYPSQDQTRILLTCAYAITVVQPDAIIKIDVTDA